MAKEFCQRGIASAAVYSGENGAYAEERNEAIRKLKNGEIRVIFSVDMFNEGVDIASLDMVMFLRPTESPVVFLQQLGRGLRLYKGKEYLNVLDFIGNYEKAGKAPLLLSGEQSFNKKGSCEYQDLEYPDDCIVDFDMRLIDLFKEMDKKKLTLKMQIQQEYYRVKELLDGKWPSRMDLFTYMDDEIYRICVSGSHAKENPFQHYLDFLYELGELSEDEQKLYAGIGREFIQTIETTEMQKVYKMPILYSFYNHGNIRLAVTDEEVLESWKEFFDTGTNWKDFPNVNTYEDYKKVTFDEGITILAGANNSGKTSLINLIKNIFVDDKLNYNMSDIPAKNMREWVEWVYPIFQKFFRDRKTEENVEKDLLNVVIPKEETDSTHLMKMTKY